jgi:hypothetical protein
MRAILIAAALLAVAPASQALATAAQPPVAAATDAFERDRQAILAQAGQYRVHFDMRENVSFRADYDPLEEKLSGGSEIVRVVYDKGDRISLQHILVMEHDGQTMVIKHWRQDWTYQPQTVLTYAGPNRWVLTPVPEAQRQGAWSQTVWQTDDSPRYGGVGRWTYDNGLTAWTSDPSAPIPTLGGNNLIVSPCGPQDQRPLESQFAASMALFRSAPLPAEAHRPASRRPPAGPVVMMR